MKEENEIIEGNHRSRLTLEDQFKAIKAKIRASFKNLQNIVSQSQVSSVYRALVEGHVRYANVIWGSVSDSKMESLAFSRKGHFDN